MAARLDTKPQVQFILLTTGGACGEHGLQGPMAGCIEFGARFTVPVAETRRLQGSFA